MKYPDPRIVDPPLCAACIVDPDPRGASACYACREIAMQNRKARALVIHDKTGVLDELRATLRLCDTAIRYGGSDPHGVRRRDRLREAIRFIEENGTSS